MIGVFFIEINITYMLYSSYQIVYYTKSSGRAPVKEYIYLFEKLEREEIHKNIEFLLQKEGRLFAPQVKHIYKKIWELRIKYVNHQHRILYFIDPYKRIVMLSAFLKKTQKTPRSEIKKAYKYYLHYLSSL